MASSLDGADPFCGSACSPKGHVLALVVRFNVRYVQRQLLRETADIKTRCLRQPTPVIDVLLPPLVKYDFPMTDTKS